MSLNLNDLMKKAKEKGLGKSQAHSSPSPLHSPWREESILFYPKEHDVADSLNNTETDKKVTINRQGTDKELAINRQENDKKGTIEITETDKKAASKPTIEVTRKRQETDRKVTRNHTFSSLVGRERQITYFLFQHCKNARSKITNPITLEHLSLSLNISKNNAKTTIQNIEGKGILIRYAFKNGRGGWSQYEVPDHIYNEIIQTESDNKPTMNRQETDKELASKPTSKPTIEDSRRRELLYIEASSNLIGEWNFDITPYEKFGFTKTRLKQLSSVNKLTADEVQQSLIEFEYDLTNRTLPTNIKTSPINYLMGGLVKGSPYTSEVYQKEMNRAASEMKAKYEARQLEQQKTAVLAWHEGLNEVEKSQMIHVMPTHLKIRYQIDGIFEKDTFTWLREYYFKARCL